MDWALLSLFPMLLLWLVGLVYPRVFAGYLSSSQQGLSKKSAWVRRKTERWLRRVVLISFPLFAMASYFLLGKSMGVAWSVPPLLYWAAGSLYRRSLKKKYELWQQLGYDGPPELEEQEKHLKAHSHVP